MPVSGFSCTPVASISVICVVLSGYIIVHCPCTVDYSFNPYIAGTVFIRQNLTSVDVRF